jgi:hypothetical protein
LKGIINQKLGDSVKMHNFTTNNPRVYLEIVYIYVKDFELEIIYATKN